MGVQLTQADVGDLKSRDTLKKKYPKQLVKLKEKIYKQLINKEEIKEIQDH